MLYCIIFPHQPWESFLKYMSAGQSLNHRLTKYPWPLLSSVVHEVGHQWAFNDLSETLLCVSIWISFPIQYSNFSPVSEHSWLLLKNFLNKCEINIICNTDLTYLICRLSVVHIKVHVARSVRKLQCNFARIPHKYTSVKNGMIFLS